MISNTGIVILESEFRHTTDKNRGSNTSTAANNSRIFLMKTKAEDCKRDLIDGQFNWNARKGDLINQWASCLEELIYYNETEVKQISDISAYIAQELRYSGVEDTDYVRKVLPDKYKNQNKVREQQGQQQGQSSNNNNNNNSGAGTLPQQSANSLKDILNQNIETVNVYQLIEECKRIAKESPTQIQEAIETAQQQDKLIRNNRKTIKEALEFACWENGIPIPKYHKESSQVPPPELQHQTELYNEVENLSNQFLDIHKYLEDIKRSIYQFPPTPEVAHRNAERIRMFNNGVMKTIKSIFLQPHSDRKWSGDWVKWVDIYFTKLEHSKNWAGAKHAIETGEIGVKFKDGKVILFKIDRGITREQVGDKEYDLLAMVKQMLFTHPLLMALHDWSYNTVVTEQYDENGNLVVPYEPEPEILGSD